MKSNLSPGEQMPRRALRLSAVLMLSLGALLLLVGLRSLGVGFIIGALLSLFSLWTLAVCIPALIRPGAGFLQKLAFGLLLWVKLPIFILFLLLSSRLGTASVLGTVLGIALGPSAIAWLTVWDEVNPSRSRTRFKPLESVSPSNAQASVSPQTVAERG